MVAIIGLLTVFVIGVAAEFEFTVDDFETLPEYEAFSNADATPLDCHLINAREHIDLTRKNSLTDYEGGFDLEIDSSRNVVPIQAGECDGRPGIMATLQNDEDISSPKVFCYIGIHIKIFENSDGKEYMRVVEKFHDSQGKNTIEVVMYVFQPPLSTEEVSNHYLTEKSVPICDFGYHPLGLYTPTHTRIDHGHYELDSVSVRINWMEHILQRAKFVKGTYRYGKYTASYMADPVIMKRQLFEEMFTYGNHFENYA